MQEIQTNFITYAISVTNYFNLRFFATELIINSMFLYGILRGRLNQLRIGLPMAHHPPYDFCIRRSYRKNVVDNFRFFVRLTAKDNTLFLPISSKLVINLDLLYQHVVYSQTIHCNTHKSSKAIFSDGIDFGCFIGIIKL